MIRPSQKQASNSSPRDGMRIYFYSSDQPPAAPNSLRSRLPAQETYFNIDWRGCGELGTAGSGYSIGSADLHNFAGHPSVVMSKV